MSDTTTEQLASNLSLTSDPDGALIDENVLAGAYHIFHHMPTQSVGIIFHPVFSALKGGIRHA